MSELELDWPDPDRRDDALMRLLIRCAEPEPELTPAQLLALRVVSHGLTEAEAATALGVSVDSVHDRLTRARRALAAKTTTQAVAEALRRRLIS